VSPSSAPANDPLHHLLLAAPGGRYLAPRAKGRSKRPAQSGQTGSGCSTLTWATLGGISGANHTMPKTLGRRLMLETSRTDVRCDWRHLGVPTAMPCCSMTHTCDMFPRSTPERSDISTSLTRCHPVCETLLSWSLHAHHTIVQACL
jgi:hypothetical protein